MELCFNPEKAAEVTLQPIRRFHMDGAILFSDILVVPYALGVDVRFAEGEGPIVEQVVSESRIQSLTLDEKKLFPIYETIARVKPNLPQDVSFIGFAGSPWTVACYMLEGPRNKSKEFINALSYTKQQPVLMQKLINTLTDATIIYLQQQADAGVEALQLFDSWAGLVPDKAFAQWVHAPTQKIVEALKKSHPHIPIIGFARGAGAQLSAYAKTGIDCIGVDQYTDMDYAISCRAHATQAVQGNLDPELLAGDYDAALNQTKKILETLGKTPAIFNYGHGMVPHTPVEHVAALSEFLKSQKQ